MHASLFSIEHSNWASISSRSFCLCNAAANSGSTAVPFTVGWFEGRGTISDFAGVVDGVVGGKDDRRGVTGSWLVTTVTVSLLEGLTGVMGDDDGGVGMELPFLAATSVSLCVFGTFVC